MSQFKPQLGKSSIFRDATLALFYPKAVLIVTAEGIIETPN